MIRFYAHTFGLEFFDRSEDTLISTIIEDVEMLGVIQPNYRFSYNIGEIESITYTLIL